MGALKKVTIYTDGACVGNPGPGGWAAILQFGDAVREVVGGEIATTNNRMELQAAIQALMKLKERCDVEIFTDSEYLREGFSKWIHAWKANGWKKKIRNKDLWLALERAARPHKVHWNWVRAHTGNKKNERCDLLATKQAQRLEKTKSAAELSRALEKFQAIRAQHECGQFTELHLPLSDNKVVSATNQ
jgi:ribonuclease HI